MKTQTLVLLLLCNSNEFFAQPRISEDLIEKNHIRSVSEYESSNGKMVLKSRTIYDQERKIISRLSYVFDESIRMTQQDTLIFRGNQSIMINRMNDEQPDSAVTQTFHLQNYDSTSTTYYKRGRIARTKSYLSDSLPISLINSEIRPNKKVEKHTWTYNYDSLGRIASAWEIDSIITTPKTVLKGGYGYIASYDQRFEKHQHFRLDGNRATITHYTYHALDNSMDSTRMLGPNSNLDYTFAIYLDEKGRDTLSIQRNRFGVITNKNITQYGHNSLTRTHADGEGNINKTVKVEFGENGLITKQETYDAATLKTTAVIYQYEYYE